MGFRGAAEKLQIPSLRCGMKEREREKGYVEWKKT